MMLRILLVFLLPRLLLLNKHLARLFLPLHLMLCFLPC